MPQSLIQRTVNTFIKGLITEASELTFPENASVDELNCSLERDGTRRRRKAVTLEENNVLSDVVVPEGALVQTLDWPNVAGQLNLEFLVVQVNNNIYFYEKSTDPLSANKYAGSVDLNTYSASNNLSPSDERIQVTALNGYLIVASPAINTFYLEFNVNSEAFTGNVISFKERDFEWQGTDLEVTSEYFSNDGSPSPQRIYDAKNVGWGQGGGPATYTYALTHAWYTGKDATGAFSSTDWEEIYTGSSLAANGHFVLNVFNKVRSGLTTEVETGRFRSVAAYAGRVFYAGIDSAKNGGKVYFSRLTERMADVGNCYQVNDPTSEILSDLLDTDGGVVRIPDAHNIRKLHVLGASLLVFAENGVWAVAGVDNVFRATEYAITRISDVGLSNENSFIVADGIPIWWGKTGIYGVQQGESLSVPTAQNLSLGTIQTFWNSISNAKKAQVMVEYDKINQRVFWFYPDNEESIDYKYNNILIMDLALQAFYPWRVADENSGTSYIIGTSYYSGLGSTSTETQVVNGADTVVNGADSVFATLFRDYLEGDSEIKLLVRDGATGKMTFATFRGDTYLDWGTADYKSFAEAGYDFMGDVTTFKNAPYITTYMRVTEDGYTASGLGYEFINPSSCLMSVSWNLSKSHSTPREIYKLKDVPVVNPNDLSSINYPTDTVVTKSKVRGRGRSMKLRFESVAGKDFHLVGYEVIGAKNNNY
ncbi:tubular protein B [Lentibacter phage vB_LenP_ICBM1]|uniref:Uncharacterized protein n=2 Tax=Siovirus germanense TaxID=2845497 RepID=A0A3G2YR69_9CAUD|nr:tail appendage [Lentibacter phage vB_LenP_ICBM1]AYP28022.1 hypothetical protein [Lentibacter phage vB_LenP_ICBM3]AYP28154.1 tubular protein B [Lentibacter phage vB_LenP_ICBM1]